MSIALSSNNLLQLVIWRLLKWVNTNKTIYHTYCHFWNIVTINKIYMANAFQFFLIKKIIEFRHILKKSSQVPSTIMSFLRRKEVHNQKHKPIATQSLLFFFTYDCRLKVEFFQNIQLDTVKIRKTPFFHRYPLMSFLNMSEEWYFGRGQVDQETFNKIPHNRIK